MKNMNIKDKQAAARRLASEFDTSLEDDNLAELMQPFFPQPEMTEYGTPYYMPNEIKAFDALFERFGLQFRSSDELFDNTLYLTQLWYRLTAHIGSHIECSRHSPRLFDRWMKEIPVDFHRYILAVKQNDGPEARRLALKLDIQNLNAFVIDGMFEKWTQPDPPLPS
jgi:hypothetical protein